MLSFFLLNFNVIIPYKFLIDCLLTYYMYMT